MKFSPLHDRIVVKRIEAEAKSAGGIIFPDTAKEKPQQGEVVAVGPGGHDESGKGRYGRHSICGSSRDAAFLLDWQAADYNRSYAVWWGQRMTF